MQRHARPADLERAPTRWLLAVWVLPVLLLTGCRADVPPPPPEPSVLEVRLLETAPPSPARVGTASRLLVRIGYRSDLPVRLGVTPLRNGAPVPAGTSGSPAWPAGEGEAIAWFFLFEPGLIDGLRIDVGYANGRGTFRSFEFPFEAEFVGGRGPAAGGADWVAPLEAKAEALRAAQVPARDTGVGDAALGLAIVSVLFGVLILGAALPIAGIARWEGNWRLGACVVLCIYALPILNVVIGGLADPTSHNLWPFELFGWALLSIGLCVALYILRRTGSARARKVC